MTYFTDVEPAIKQIRLEEANKLGIELNDITNNMDKTLKEFEENCLLRADFV